MIGLEQLAARIRIPRQEADAMLLAVLERLIVTPVGQTVSILDSRNSDDLAGVLNLRRSYLAQADVANLALLLHPLQSAERFFERGAGIDAVKLVEVDAVEPEPAQADRKSTV